MSIYVYISISLSLSIYLSRPHISTLPDWVSILQSLVLLPRAFYRRRVQRRAATIKARVKRIQQPRTRRASTREARSICFMRKL